LNEEQWFDRSIVRSFDRSRSPLGSSTTPPSRCRFSRVIVVDRDPTGRVRERAAEADDGGAIGSAAGDEPVAPERGGIPTRPEPGRDGTDNEELAEGIRRWMDDAVLLERMIDECQAVVTGRQLAMSTAVRWPTLNVSNMSIAPAN
jgi:hypothetical protein